VSRVVIDFEALIDKSYMTSSKLGFLRSSSTSVQFVIFRYYPGGSVGAETPQTAQFFENDVSNEAGSPPILHSSPSGVSSSPSSTHHHQLTIRLDAQRLVVVFRPPQHRRHLDSRLSSLVSPSWECDCASNAPFPSPPRTQPPVMPPPRPFLPLQDQLRARHTPLPFVTIGRAFVGRLLRRLGLFDSCSRASRCRIAFFFCSHVAFQLFLPVLLFPAQTAGRA
jgi:hypothetical protein